MCEAAAAIGELLDRIGGLLRERAREAADQVAVPFRPIGTGPCPLWPQVELPMGARVCAALTKIRRARLARVAGVDVVCILPDTLRPAEVEIWLRRHDMLSDAWMQVFGETTTTTSGS